MTDAEAEAMARMIAQGDGQGQGEGAGGGTTDRDSGGFEGPFSGSQDDPNADGTPSEYDESGEGVGTAPVGLNKRARGVVTDVTDSPEITVTGVGPSGDVATPYYDVATPSDADIEDAMEHDQIPAAERQLVKGYFDAIRPTTE